MASIKIHPVMTMDAGRRVYSSRVHCECGAHLDVRSNSAGAPPPDFIQRKAKGHGWSAKGGKMMCPTCLDAKPVRAAALSAQAPSTKAEKPTSYTPSPEEIRSRNPVPFSEATIRWIIERLDDGATPNLLEKEWGIRNGGRIIRELLVPFAKAGRPLPSHLTTQAKCYLAGEALSRPVSRKEVATVAPLYNLGPPTLEAHMEAFEHMDEDAMRPIIALAERMKLEAEKDAEPNVSARDMFSISVALDPAIDKARGTYLAGWDDNRVASIAGVAPEAVKVVREGAFGAPVADPVLDAALARLGRLETEASEVRTAIGGLMERLDRIERGIATTMDELTLRS